MRSTLQRVTENWHAMRILRLAIGIWGAVVGIQTRDWAIGLFSAFFLYQALTNTGCCGANACSPGRTPGRSNQQAGDVEVDYEEVK